MTPSTVVFLSSAVSFGAPLLLAVYEIVTMRRSPRSGDDDDRRRPAVAPLPKPLPDCLLPANLLRRGRIPDFEDA
ncbi:MAG: hypothetical protein ACRYG4_19225 [Janthinobacterium lividum]